MLLEVKSFQNIVTPQTPKGFFLSSVGVSIGEYVRAGLKQLAYCKRLGGWGGGGGGGRMNKVGLGRSENVRA